MVVVVNDFFGFFSADTRPPAVFFEIVGVHRDKLRPTVEMLFSCTSCKRSSILDIETVFNLGELN